MTKLISGRVAKVPSANVSADRYEFLDISQAEPDLGLPPVSGYVLAANANGTRFWTNPAAAAAGAAQFAGTAGSANVSLLANVANTVLTISNFSTANLIEGTNLYFTNARVVSAVTPLLTTSNVFEGTNQYFTNARVLVGVTTGTIAGSLNLTGNITGANNIIVGSGAGGYISGVQALYSNIIYANTLIIDNNVIFSTGQGANLTVTRIVTNSITSNSWNGLYTANVIESSTNLYFTNARVVSALIAGQNITIEANGRISANTSSGESLNLTTADVRETSNLYFTNARVVSAITPLLTTANVIETSGNLYFTTARVNATVQPFLTTANVVETSGNLYFTTARVNATVQPFLTTANVIETSANLYFTNARVVSALIAGQNIVIEANGRISANASSGASLSLTTADVRETSNLYFTNARVVTVVTPFLTTANVIETSANLYFTNTRAVSAFTAGKGIVIQENGLIKTATAPAEYNLYIDGSAYGNVLSTMSTMVTMPSATAGDRFIIRSIHITNISDTTDALLSGNVLYATGNTAMLVNQIPIPVGGVVDLMKRGQLLSPGDKINLQGFTSAGTAAANLLSAMFTYETLAADSSYIGVGQTLATSNTNILVYDSDQAASIIESIKIVNLRNSIIPVKLYWGDANGLVKTHLAHNLAVPNNSSIELLINPKRIEKTDRLYASYRNAENNSISVFISARLTATFALSNYDANVIPGSSPLISIATTEAEGTILYYSIE
jgi:hypothetical protein